MSTPSLSARRLLAAPTLLIAACLGPQPDQVVRYYSVELEPATAPADDAEPAGTLRVRRLSAAGHLADAIALRSSAVSFEFLEADRWTEPPLGYLAVALDRALFESGAFARSEGSDASALDVELQAFELDSSAGNEVVCVLSAKLTSPSGEALLDQSFEAHAPLQRSTAELAARALGGALSDAVQQLAAALAAAGA